jgi:hypothetical protein
MDKVTKVFKENLREAIEDSKNPGPTGKIHGYIGIAVGIIGLFLPIFLPIFAGVIAATLGAFANKHGQRLLGIICGALALINTLFFFISLGIVL